MSTMNIGEAADASGVSAKMIRHYEEIGLFPAPPRTDSGYRRYGDAEVHTLRFIRHSRDLGFSLEQIRELVGLWHDRSRPSRQVKELAQAHLQSLRQKTRELMAMTATLEALVHCCHGDERPDCPILATLADEHVDPPANNGEGHVGPPANNSGGHVGAPANKGAERTTARRRGQRA